MKRKDPKFRGEPDLTYSTVQDKTDVLNEPTTIKQKVLDSFKI